MVSKAYRRVHRWYSSRSLSGRGSRICSGSRESAFCTAAAICREESPAVAGYTGWMDSSLASGRNSGESISRRSRVPVTLPRNRYISPSRSRVGMYLLLKKVRAMSLSPSDTVVL